VVSRQETRRVSLEPKNDGATSAGGDKDGKSWPLERGGVCGDSSCSRLLSHNWVGFEVEVQMAVGCGSLRRFEEQAVIKTEVLYDRRRAMTASWSGGLSKAQAIRSVVRSVLKQTCRVRVQAAWQRTCFAHAMADHGGDWERLGNHEQEVGVGKQRSHLKQNSDHHAGVEWQLRSLTVSAGAASLFWPELQQWKLEPYDRRRVGQ